jgi:hypothetical protein
MVSDTISILPALTHEEAEQWIASALAESRALEQHESLMFPLTNDPAAVKQADDLRQALQQWTDAASVLYNRLLPLFRGKRRVAGATDLRDTIGFARATLGITTAEHLQAIEQVRRGQVVSHEEVRREVRDRLDRRRTAGLL